MNDDIKNILVTNLHSFQPGPFTFVEQSIYLEGIRQFGGDLDYTSESEVTAFIATLEKLVLKFRSLTSIEERDNGKA